MSVVVNSSNFFVDTSKSEDGDDTTIQLHGQSINASPGQQIKVVLSEFSMYRPTSTINPNNNAYQVLVVSNGTPHNLNLEISPRNYSSVGSIANSFGLFMAAQLAAAINVALDAARPVETTPDLNYTPESDGSGRLQVTIQFAQPHQITNMDIRLFDDISDSYLILGGDRLPTGSNGASLDINVPSPNILVVTGRYPMQLTSDPFIYLRTDVRSSNFESAALSSQRGMASTQTIASNILGKIPVSFDFCTYSQEGPHDEFFCILNASYLSSMRLYLTDHRGRPLGRRMTQAASRTSFGSGTDQSRTGNLFFTGIIRIDIIQKQPPHMLQAPQYPMMVDPKKGGYNPLLMVNTQS